MFVIVGSFEDKESGSGIVIIEVFVMVLSEEI